VKIELLECYADAERHWQSDGIRVIESKIGQRANCQPDQRKARTRNEHGDERKAENDIEQANLGGLYATADSD
jgi:hypothetical protein